MNPVVSFWANDAAARGAVPAASPAVEAPMGVDVLVVGGGFAGLSAAIEIARAEPRRRVALVEAHRVGFGASGRNAGMLQPVMAPTWLVDGALGPDEARWGFAEAYRRARAAVAALGRLDGGPERGTMYLCAPSRVALEALRWLRGRLGAFEIDAVLLSPGGAEASIGERCRGGLALEAYGIHPARFALSLGRLAREAGVEVFEHTRVERLEPGASFVDVTTDAGVRMRAGRVVIASGAWVGSLAVRTGGSVAQTWMLASARLGGDVAARLGGGRAFVASLKPGFMYRRVFDDRLLLGGLDDAVRAPLPAGFVPDDVLPRLRSLLAASLPSLHGLEVEQVWGGPVHASSHELPAVRVAKESRRIVIIEGLSGAGVLWGLVAGRLARGLLAPSLDTPDDKRLRHALLRTRLPALGALSLGGKLALRALLCPSATANMG